MSIKNPIDGRSSVSLSAMRKRERDIKRKMYPTDEDTKIRCEIHGIIAGGVKAKKSKAEIIEDLSKIRYEKYAGFFDSWIEDEFKKTKTKVNRNITR